MMATEALTALLGGIACAGLVWSTSAMILKPSGALARRDRSADGADWVGAVRVTVRKLRKQMTYAEALTDEVCRDLYLGGVRDYAQVKAIRLSGYFAIAAGIAFFVISASSGSHFFKAVQAALPGFFGYLGIKRYARSKREKRQTQIDFELPEMMDLMTVAVEAGIGFIPALQTALERLTPKSPLQQEFDTMVQEHLGGIPLPEACERMAQRCGVESISILMSNIIQSQQLGTSLGDMLRIVASDLRDKQRQRMKEKAMQIPVKILAPSMLIFSSLMFLLIGPSLIKLISTLSNN